jgi:hypothetical protein
MILMLIPSYLCMSISVLVFTFDDCLPSIPLSFTLSCAVWLYCPRATILVASASTFDGLSSRHPDSSHNAIHLAVITVRHSRGDY